MEGKTQNLFTKNCVFILTCLNFSHLQSTLRWMQYIYQYICSTAQSSFWTHRFFMLFSASAVFRFIPSSTAKHFPLRPFFIWENKKVILGEIRWIGGQGTGVMPFLVKNCWTLSMVWAGVLLNHPSWNGQMHWKSLQINSLKPNTASHNTSRDWYRWVPRTLT